jgi:glycine oxidase
VLAAALAKGAAMLGAELHEYSEVSELLFEQGRVVGVQTAAGRFNADHVVIAAGVWSGRLMRELGLDGGLYPVQGECFSVTTAKPLIRKTIFSESCYVVPKAGGRLIVGATVHPYSYDRKVSLSGLAYLMEQAQRLVPAIAEAEWEQCWSGLRPQTGDGRPYIGKVEGYGELYVAAGHYRNGILLGPITGIVIAEQIAGKGHEGHSIYSPNRMQQRGGLRTREELSSVETYN